MVDLSNDTDEDGIPDFDDEDMDGDGEPNSTDDDIDGDEIPNSHDNDDDGGGYNSKGEKAECTKQ